MLLQQVATANESQQEAPCESTKLCGTLRHPGSDRLANMAPQRTKKTAFRPTGSTGFTINNMTLSNSTSRKNKIAFATPERKTPTTSATTSSPPSQGLCDVTELANVDLIDEASDELTSGATDTHEQNSATTDPESRKSEGKRPSGTIVRSVTSR